MNKIILGGVVTLVVAGILAITGWNFKVTAEVSEKYVKKTEQQIFIERNDEEHQQISKKLDKIYDHLIKKTD